MANEIIRPDLLPKRASPAPSEAVPSDDGSSVAGVTWADGVNAAVPVSSQAESEAGVNNSKRMTPLTTKQAIDYQVPPKISTAIGALNLGSASQASVGDFATAAQGAKADSAVQPGVTISAGSGLTGGGTLAANRTIALNSASIASLALADSAVQADMLADVAFSGSYDDLSDRPTIPQGTVTSVGVTAPTGLSVSGSPVTSAGTIALSYASGYQGYTSAEASKLAGIAAGAQVNTVTSVAGKTGAVTLTASDVGAAPSSLVSDINSNTAARHTHANKAILDATTASFLAAEKTKLAGIAPGATANTGTVTSVGVAVPAGFSASGPIATSGNVTISYAAGYQGYTSTEASKLAGIQAGADKTPTLAAVATTGNYEDLDGKPTLGSLAAKNKVDIADLSATGTPNAGTFLRGDNTWGAVAGAGTVTSVAMTVPTGLSVSGSPITGAGTIAVTYAAGYQGYTTAEANKLNGIEAGAQVNTVTSVAGKTGAVTLAKGDVGLGSVDNTSDANKPVSTAQGVAINAKVTKANDTGLGGFAVSGKSLGNLSGSLTPTHVGGNYQTGTITGALTINAPTAPGVYDLKIELLIGAGAGAVTLAGFSNTDFGEAFTTAAGDFFILQIEKGATRIIATVRKPT